MEQKKDNLEKIGNESTLKRYVKFWLRHALLIIILVLTAIMLIKSLLMR